MIKTWSVPDLGHVILIIFIVFDLRAIAELYDAQESVKTPIHLLMTKKEKRLVFGNHNRIPSYEMVRPSKSLENRQRRFSKDVNDSSHALDIHLITEEKQLLLHLRPQRSLTNLPLAVEIVNDNGTDIQYLTKHSDCLYHGYVHGVQESTVALSWCTPEEMNGLIHISHSDKYVLVPLPRRFRRENSKVNFEDDVLQDHILYKKVDENFCGWKHTYSPSKTNLRSIRDISDQSFDNTHGLNKTIETAVFVDDELYKLFKESHPDDDPVKVILDMIFAMMNAVQIIYNQPSLTVQINIVLVKVVILTSDSVSPSKAEGNIRSYLKSFCYWQSRRNPRSDNNESHWDHALMLSGLDLYMDDPENTVVIGLSWVSGMCHHLFSCSINEGTTFESVYVISHELGHNLGMHHDGEDDNGCSDTDYLMSPSLGPGKTTWSKCSDRYLRKFIRTSASHCLNDFVDPKGDLDHRSTTFPGERYNAKVQCKLSFGSKYLPYVTDEDPFDDMCRELWCANGTIARRAHPALVGTRCGSHKVCFHGKCVQKSKVTEELILRELLLEDN